MKHGRDDRWMFGTELIESAETARERRHERIALWALLACVVWFAGWAVWLLA